MAGSPDQCIQQSTHHANRLPAPAHGWQARKRVDLGWPTSKGAGNHCCLPRCAGNEGCKALWVLAARQLLI
jgi:hypothetical protein